MAQPATPSADVPQGPCSAPLAHPGDEQLLLARVCPAAPRHIAVMYAGVVTPLLPIGRAEGLDAAGMTRLIAGPATVLPTAGLADFAGNRLPFVTAAGGTLLVPGALPVLGAVVCLAPVPVFGGAGIVLFGSIAVSGIRTLSEAASAQTVLGAGALIGVLLNLFFHHLGTRSRTAAALKSS